MKKNTLITAIYAAILGLLLSASASAASLVCEGPNLSAIVYDHKGATKLIFKKGNALPVSAVCQGVPETKELACREDLTGETVYFKFNKSTRQARIDIGQIKIYGLKCPLPQKKPARLDQSETPADTQI